MTSQPTPSIRDVFFEQMRAVAASLRLPAIAGASLMAFITLGIAMDFARGRGGVDFAPELSMIPGVAGLLLPIAVWRGAERFGSDFFWTLPVDRRQHALARVFAGLVCLLAAVAAFVVWMLLLAGLTGGDILAEKTINVIPSGLRPDAGELGPSALQQVLWKSRPVLWLVPFTAATGTYILASALALGARHPLRWIIGTVLAALILGAGGAAGGVVWMREAPADLIHWVHQSSYGFDALLTARTESLKTLAILSTGKTVEVWLGLPSVGQWITATLLWISGGLLLLWAAASRHQERRRAE